MNQVDFIIGGMGRSGTSALYRYLEDNSEVGLPDLKGKNDDLDFFLNDSNFMNIEPIRYKLHGFFKDKGKKSYGICDPHLTYWESCLPRVLKYNHLMRIILLLRNPIERAYSQWNLYKSAYRERLSFMEALLFEDLRAKGRHIIFSYVDRGFYSEQIRRLFRFFPREQCLIMKSTTLANDPQKCLNDVCDFINVKKMKIKKNYGIVGSVNRHRAMLSKEKDYLKHIYYYDIKQLERMLGWNCEEWLI